MIVRFIQGSRLSPARLLSLTSRSVCTQCIIDYVPVSLLNILYSHNTLKCLIRNGLFYHNHITLSCLYVICTLRYLFTHLHMVTFVMNSLNLREMYQCQKSLVTYIINLTKWWNGFTSYHHYLESIIFDFLQISCGEQPLHRS